MGQKVKALLNIVSVDTHTEASRWDSFVQSAKDATSYHQFGWKAVITKSFGHQCHYLAAIDDKGGWQGVLPLVHMRSRIFGNFIVSVPFVNYGGLLCRDEAATSILLGEADKLRRLYGATHVELRHVAQSIEGVPTKLHKVTMVLELASDVDAQWQAFSPKLRNQVRKAERGGLRSVIGHLELLDGFYQVFTRNMRDLGTPVYAKSFFRSVLEAFPETTRIFAVDYGGRTIAAGIASWFRDAFEIPWASSISDYKSLCPNNMLYWEAMRFAINNGFRRFDFGRSTPLEGTYKFKKQWGALPVQLHWQYLMDVGDQMLELNPENPKYQVAIRAWKRLPVPVTRILGPPIVRNIP
ncbi:MAG: FemAB family PEP-CTERM system-associated protein [Gammaproteobacteria bacterium]|nr:FemAB family PEP-CTERM system-associated protein [Gammaproteobacteria bacterium]